MGRTTRMYKPGEQAGEAGSYYCHICAMRGESSTCRMEKGQRFSTCPRCLERNVPEWDLTWKPESARAPKSGAASPWPGSLAKR